MALTEMASVVFTPKQMKAIETLAKIEGRKVGNLIRFATVKYLIGSGVYSAEAQAEEADDDE